MADGGAFARCINVGIGEQKAKSMLSGLEWRKMKLALLKYEAKAI